MDRVLGQRLFAARQTADQLRSVLSAIAAGGQAHRRRGARRPHRRRLRIRAAGIARLHSVFVARAHAGAESAARCRLFVLRRISRRRHPARRVERGETPQTALARRNLTAGTVVSYGLWVLLGVFTLAAVLGAPLGLSM